MGKSVCGVENVKARSLAHRRLVSGELLRIVDRTVVVDLTPPAVPETEDARGPDGETECFARCSKGAALAANGIKKFARIVNRVIEEFHFDRRGTLEYPLVDGTNIRPAALDTAHRIIERGDGGRFPIFLHERQIAAIESAIEL